MDRDNVTDAILRVVEKRISDEVDQEIKQKVLDFSNELMDRKDRYISEIMKGIRVYHEQSDREMCMNYRIVFENTYRIR